MVSGRIGPLRFRFSELHVETDRGAGRDPRWLNVFDGLFFEFTLPAPVTGETYVLPDPGVRTPGLARSRMVGPDTAPVTRVKLEHPAFERYFEVYGSSPNDVPTLLTSRMRKWLVDLQLRTEPGLCASFVGDRLYLAIPYLLPLFEPKIVASMLASGALDEYLDLLLLALGIAERIGLDFPAEADARELR